MKRVLAVCLISVAMMGMCQADEVVLTEELEEVASANGCPCSKSCRCDESCRCRISGCRGCCDQYKDKTKADTCVTAYCDCEITKCGCGCSDNNNKSCCG